MDSKAVGGVTVGLVLVALTAMAPAAHADDQTGTPTPSTTTTTATASAPTSTKSTTTASASGTAPTSTAPSPTSSSTSSSPSSTAPTPTPTQTVPASPVVLRMGNTGWAVKDLQARLAVLGRPSGTVDGVFDAGVATALARFLSANRLPGNGTELTAAARTLLVKQTATPVVIAAGSRGTKVTDLQSRLAALKPPLWTHAVDGAYGTGLGQQVLAFQRSQALPQSGVVDSRTWSRLVARTATPVVITRTSPAANIKELQRRLSAKGLWPYAANGGYGWGLAQQVLAFQRAYHLPQSGVVDSRTWARLRAVTYTPGTFDKHRYYAGLRPLMPSAASLDKRCRVGRVMCVDKPTRTLTWVVNGKPLMVMWARFGGPGRETREGTFRVSRKYEYVISNLYFTPMPYSMFFSGGQAVHYSSNFARLGYASSSHGCVNIADRAQVKSLFFKVRVGDKVVVRH
ncbi:peptidoglycan-binding protein [Terrabacter sp. NPDC080008]|uniref:L,D-transpeptidase family protein n=1 Tax=Terrabacter sp. NPDC080008 TaxID=3155176 RepID=UPI00344B6A3F